MQCQRQMLLAKASNVTQSPHVHAEGSQLAGSADEKIHTSAM